MIRAVGVYGVVRALASLRQAVAKVQLEGKGRGRGRCVLEDERGSGRGGEGLFWKMRGARGGTGGPFFSLGGGLLRKVVF